MKAGDSKTPCLWLGVTGMFNVRTRRRLFCFTILPLLLSSAACGYLVSWPEPEVARASLVRLLAPTEKEDSLWADGWLRLGRGSQSAVFPVEVLLAYPDRVRITIFGLFDRPEGYLASDGKTLQLYVPSQGRLYEGEASAHSLWTMLGIPSVELPELLGYLGGRVPIDSKRAAALTRDQWKGNWVARYGTLALEERVTFARDGGQVLGFERTVPGQKLLVNFSQYKRPPGAAGPLPYRVEMAAPEAGAFLRTTYREVEPGADVSNEALFTLTVPPHTERIPLKDAALLLQVPSPAGVGASED